MRRVLHIGPPLHHVGGVATVAANIQAMDWGEAYVLEYFPQTAASSSHESAIRKVVRHVRHAIRLRRYWAERAPEIVHQHLCSGFSFWRTLMDSLIVPRRPRSARLVHLHGGGFEAFYREGSWLRKGCIRRLLTGADAVVVLSEQWKCLVSQMAPKARLIVIPNGVLAPAPSVFRANRPVIQIGCLAKLDREKGILDLIGAVRDLASNNRIVLRIAGPPGNLGDHRTLLDHLARETDPKNVELIPALEAPARDLFLRESDIFVLASHAEGLPMVLLEAMARAVPVVATSVGGIPELIRHGQNGLLAPPCDRAALRDALGVLVEDEALRQQIGQAGRKTVLNRFSLCAQRNRLTQLYGDLISGIRGSSTGEPLAAASVKKAVPAS